ncbi:hypothetical protein VTK73DRAFT_4860 [Phialemonium thermophilum]|uniref:Secreted protein n=1 Tax=Phialemonium thermophilum TaxID=223376 RepID=A0ABR3V5S7_9PEZI
MAWVRVLATLDSAAFLASGSSSGTGSFLMFSLNRRSLSSADDDTAAASLWACEMGSTDAVGTEKPSASLGGVCGCGCGCGCCCCCCCCEGGGPSGGGTSKMSSAVPLRRFVDGCVEAAPTPFVAASCDCLGRLSEDPGGKGDVGLSASDDRRWLGSVRLWDEARGEMVLPWLLPTDREKGPRFFCGESAPNPPWMLCRRRPNMVPMRLRSLFSWMVSVPPKPREKRETKRENAGAKLTGGPLLVGGRMLAGVVVVLSRRCCGRRIRARHAARLSRRRAWPDGRPASCRRRRRSSSSSTTTTTTTSTATSSMTITIPTSAPRCRSCARARPRRRRRRRRPLLQLGLSRGGALGKGLDLLAGVDLQHGVEHLLGGGLGAGGLVDLVGEQLGQDVAQVVDALLVEGLQGLEDEGGLRLPLLGGGLEAGGGLVDLVGVGLAALARQLVGAVLGLLQLAGHGLQVGGDGVHVLHLALVLEGAQRLLDVLLDALREQLVRGGDGVGRLQDLIPGRLEDAGAGPLAVSNTVPNVPN